MLRERSSSSPLSGSRSNGWPTLLSPSRALVFPALTSAEGGRSRSLLTTVRPGSELGQGG